MTLTPTLTLLIALGVPGGMYTGTLFYLNTTYTRADQGPFLTVQEYKLAGAESNVQNLQNEVDGLQWDVDNGEASEKDKWLLEQKKRQLEEWKQQVIKIKEGRSTA